MIFAFFETALQNRTKAALWRIPLGHDDTRETGNHGYPSSFFGIFLLVMCEKKCASVVILACRGFLACETECLTGGVWSSRIHPDRQRRVEPGTAC